MTIVITVMPGCGASSSQPEISNQYTLKPGKADNFYVLYSSLDDTKKPRNITYLFSGAFQNNTNNLYAEGTINMKVSITLENGNVLTEKDLTDVPFNDILSHQFFHNWMPGQTVKINRLRSISIPIEYADYPVKDVVLEYSLELTDKINQTHEEIDLASISVIDKWRAAVKKVRTGKVDADDSNFLDRILNGEAAGDSPKHDDKKELIDE
jgi:hypothetical protein